MFCMKCGTQLSQEAVFCHKCGQQVGASMQPTYAQPAQQAYAQPTQAYAQPHAQVATKQYGKKAAIWSFIVSLITLLFASFGFTLGIVATAKRSLYYYYYYYYSYSSSTARRYRRQAVACGSTGVSLSGVSIALFAVALILGIKAIKGFVRTKRETGVANKKTLIWGIVGLSVAVTALALGVYGLVASIVAL